jgi:O-antigen/teichoic acid export membrane protein
VLGVLSSKAEVGLFGVGFKVLEGLLALPYFVTITLMPEFARLAENRDRLDALVERATRLLQFFVIPMVIGLLAFANEVTAVVGGSEFEGSANVIRILALGVAATFITGVLAQALVALNRQAQMLVLVSALLLVNVGLCFALIPSLGARGAALAFLISEIAALLGMLLLYGRSGRMPSPRVQPALLMAAGAMGGVALLTLVLTNESVSPAVVLVFGGTATMGTYVGCLYALRAVPVEIQDGVVRPLWGHLRRISRARRRSQ